MAQRKAIIRKLPAVETLGAVSVICTDKTGTLTRNEMTVRKVATANSLFEIEGTGYDPHGVISLDKNNIRPENEPVLMEVLQAGLLCNDASLEPDTSPHHQKQCVVHGDPMEGALLVADLKAGLDIESVSKQFPRTDLIPFESEHKFMATLHHSHTGKSFIYLKGAPERVLEMCSHQSDNNGDQAVDTTYWLDRIEEMAQQGQRVLAIAVKPANSHQRDLNFSDVESGLTMLGLFGFIDPSCVAYYLCFTDYYGGNYGAVSMGNTARGKY